MSEYMLYRVPFQTTVEFAVELVATSEEQAIRMAKKKLAEMKPITIYPPVEADWISERESSEGGWQRTANGWVGGWTSD